VFYSPDNEGVLIRGGIVLSQTQRALRKLYGENRLGIRLPVIFLTNGGGVTEARKAQELSKKFGVPVRPEQGTYR
jgi:ribonucleotide monophosphatase NagD (HAD superfamily)